MLAVLASAYGAEQTFVLLDSASGQFTRQNPERASLRFAPCSTFKIPNSAIALESGVAGGLDFMLKYDPLRDHAARAVWARDYDLQSAFKASAVWYYQEMARRVGMKQMTKFLTQFQYGNQDASGGIDKFWLGNSLRISPNEQVDFLRRLYEGRLGLSVRTTNLVKEIMLVEQTADWRLSAKTGACRAEGEDVVLWYVGWVEKPGHVYYFALEIGDKEYDPLFEQRVPIARKILTELGVLR
jgi:beta-lactamase class D